MSLIEDSRATASAPYCPSLFVSQNDLLAKSGLSSSDIMFETYYRPDEHVWIELRRKDRSMIGSIGLWLGGRKLSHIEIVLLQEGFEGKGFGFLLYSVASHVAQMKYGRTLSGSRGHHSMSAEVLWRKLISSGAADIRYLSLLELWEYLNNISPVKLSTGELSQYVEQFGQTIYVMRDDTSSAKSAATLYESRNQDKFASD